MAKAKCVAEEGSGRKSSVVPKDNACSNPNNNVNKEKEGDYGDCGERQESELGREAGSHSGNPLWCREEQAHSEELAAEG